MDKATRLINLYLQYFKKPVQVAKKRLQIGANSPPSVIPAGTTVTIQSGYRWTGYLSNNLEGITAITGTTYTVPSGKVLVITAADII